MSRHPSFDRKKGFIALPVEILEIDLSPGAFRLLAELCRMANTEGQCWPSLAQLSDRMGRSRASVSGYIRELRDTDLLTTEEQKTANGYNYRLKYQVTFWKEWRASLTGRTVQKSERRVQPVERLKEDKNQINKNHSTPPARQDLDNLLVRWANVFRGAPYPACARNPEPDLLNLTRSATAGPEPIQIISADIIQKLTSFWRSKNVETDAAKLQKQAQYLRDLTPDPIELAHLLSRISHHWEPHWRRCPDIDQFTRLVKKTGITTTAQKRKLLVQHLKRWEMAQKSLRNPPMSVCVSFNKNQSENAVA